MYSNSYQKYLEQKEKNKSSQNLSDTLQQFRERAIADYSAQQQLEEESVARGRAMVEAQKARDTINQAASNTAATYDFAHGQLPSISTAQAFANAQRQTSLDDSLNQIMGNNVLTDAGRVSQAQEAFGSLLSAPTVSSTPTAREVANAYRQSYANINTPIQKAAQAVEAYKEEREKVWEEARKKQAEDIGSQRNVGALTRELNRKKQENSQKAWELSLEMQNAGSVERVNEIQKQIDALNESTNRTQQQLDNAIAAQDYLLRYNDNFAENARYDENIIGGLPKTTGGNNTAALYQFINGRYQAKEGDPALDMWRIYTYLDDNERGTFNYLLKTEGAERADEYLQRLQPELEARNAQAISKRAYEYGRTNPWKAAAGTVAFSPLRTLGALGTAYDELVNGKVNENAWYNTQSQVLGSARSGALDTFGESVTNSGVVQGIANSRPVSYFAERVLDQSPKEVAENVGKVAKFLGSGTLSHLDSLWNGFLMQNISALQGGMNWGDAQKIYQLEKDNPGLISSINPEAADRAKKIVTGAEELTRAVMGAEVVSDAVREAKERGLSDEQAFELGMVAGAAEYITEKWSIGDLFESDWTKPTLTKMLTHGGGEFSEEIMSSLINEIADISVAGEKSQFRQDFNEYKKNGASDGKAFAHTLLDHALEAGKEGLSAFLTTGVSVGLTSVQQNIYNPQTIHNKVSAADKKSGGNVGATVDGMLADLINRPETEWASGLADIANQFRGTVRGNTMNAVRNYIRETARNQADAFDNGAYTALADYLTPYKDQNGKKVDNRNAVWQLAEERNGTAKQTAQNTQTETAPSTESTTPSTAPSTLSTESTTAPSTESTTPQIQATNAENQAITADNQATTQQTAQNVSQTSENAPVAENAVETENNTVAENEAQRGSVSATDDGRALLLRELNVSEEATDAEVAQELLKRVDSRKVRNRITGLRNTAANNQAEVLDRMRQSGQYTPEQIEAARQTAVAVGRELGNLTSEVGVQKAVNAANAALQKAGIKAKIVVDNVAKVDYNGRVNERGSYKDSDGTIHVSPYLDTNEAIMGVLAHEMFHKAADGSERTQLVDDILAARNAILNASQSGKYGISRVTRAVIGNNSMGDFVESYGDLLMKDFGLTEEGQTALQNKLNANPGMDTDTALKKLCDENEEAFWEMWHDNKNLGTAQRYMKEEVAAHFFEELGSQHGEAIMRELMRNDRNLFERIIDAVRRYFHRNDPDYARNETYNRIMNAYERIAAEEAGTEARKLKGTAAQKAESEKATTSELNSSELKEAVENHEPLSVKDEVRASRLLDSKLYQEAFDKQFGKTKKKLALITPEDKALWARLKKVRSTVKQRLDEIAESANLPADVVGQTTFGNSSYGKTNENTTICPRTLSLDALADQVAEDLGRPLTVEESVYVAQEAFNFTQTPQCVYCYVAMDRFAKREVLLDYVEKRKRVYADLDKGLSVEQALENYKKLETSGGKKWSVSGEDSDKKARFDMWVRNYQQGKRGVILSDLASERALERSLADPELAEEVNDALAYAQSASWAKKKVGYAAYGGDILRWNKKAVDALNSMFGLRMYSFSDYSPAFILENMQMVTDAAVKKLKMLAYTKELDFVKIFAGTGMNINISVFSMNGRDQYGDFAEDAMQGAPWKEAQALRDKYPNVGITYVATNDEQVEWALDQPWIDVVIPFHMVKTGAKVAKIFGYQNYTGESHDTKIKGLEATQKEIFPNQHQNSKEKYFAALKEANLEPRFARWQNHPNYMKLVNETRRSAQDTPAVQPIFDLQAALDSINGMVERGGYAVPIGGSLEQQAKIANMMAENISAGVAKDLQIREGIILKDGKPITFNTLLGDMEEDDDSDYDRQSRMVSSEQDEKYMNAVESNNMDQVQRIVDEAARNAGYTIKVYHGTPLETVSASRGRLQGEAYRNLQTDYADKLFPFVVFKDNGRLTGIYTATDRGIAENFSFNFSDTGTVYDLYAKADNPFRFDAHGNGWNNIPADSLSGLGITKTGKITLDDVAKAAKAQSYDAVIVDNVRETGSGDSDSPVTTDVIVFDSNQIKSAEPVTYDDNGDVIPVSERFNSKKADVRYSRLVTPEQDAEYMEAVESGDTEKQQRMVDDAAKEAGFRKYKYGYVEQISPSEIEPRNEVRRDRLPEIEDRINQTTEWVGRPILAAKNGDSYIGITGSHRLYIAQEAGIDVDTVVIDDDAMKDLADYLEDNTGCDLDDFMNRMDEDQQADILRDAISEGNESLRDAYVLMSVETESNFSDHADQLVEDPYIRMDGDDMIVKSADPVTYDNDGNPIPLSERFNPENEDIRYSREVGNSALYNDMYNGEYLDYDRSELGAKLWEQIDSLDETWDLHENELDDTTNAFLTDLRNSLDDMATANTQSELWRAYTHFKKYYGFIEDDYFHDELRADVGRSLDLDEIENIYNARMKQMADEDNPNNYDMRFSRMLKSDSDYEQALAEEREKRDFLTKQFVGKNSFGYAKALEKSKHDAIVKRYTDLFGEDIPADEINRVIREFERIMERPKRDANDTAEARMEEAWSYLEQQVRGWVERTSYENVLKETIGDEGTLEGLVALRTALRDPDDPGYYYIKPDMVTAAGSNDAWNETRRQLNGVKLKGFATQAEAEASGRKPIGELWSKLTTDGGAYNGLFTADGKISDYDALSQIASMFSLSKETESPYERRALGEYDNTGEVNAIVNDIMYAWEEAAEITQMGKAAQAADAQIAKANQQTAEAQKALKDNDLAARMAEGRAVAQERRRGDQRVQAEKAKADERVAKEQQKTEKVDRKLLATQMAAGREQAEQRRRAQEREAAMKKRFDESYDRLRRSYDRKLDRASERYDKLQNRIKGKDIKRAQRMVLGRIAKDISALDKLQNHPSKEKNKYIPQRLLGTVAKVREAVQNFANRSGKTIDPVRLAELQQSAMDETQNFMEGLGQGLKGVGSATEANARQDPNITDVFIRQADNLIQQLRDLRADIEENHPARPTVDENGKRITPTSEMIAEDNAREEAMYEYFNTVRQLLDMTLQAIRNEGKIILNGRTQDLREVSQLLASDLKQHRQKDVSLKHRNLGSETGNWFQTGTFGLMSADAALQRLGDNWHSFIARSVREGQNRQMKHQADFSDFMRETIGDYDITKGGFYGDYVTLERPDGTKFNVTRNELMSLYALWNRPAGRLHLENGGGTFINQNGQAFHDNNVVLTDELVKEYTDHLTDQEKEIVDKVVDYMSHEASKWGNDVSMYVYGYRLFNEDSYFPMEVADYANKRSFADPTMPGSGLNPGFTQALTRSKKPLAIRDFFDVVNDHIIGMSNYNAYGAAAHDLDRILNSSLKDGGKETSMIEMLRKTYGNSAVNYLKGFVQKLAGTKHNDPSILDTLRTMGYLSGNLYKRAAVSWNLSTAAKQPLSIIRAANEIDPKYLIFRKPLSPSEYAAAKEKMESLSGIAKIKSLGYSDTGHAKSLQATYDDKYFSDSNFIRRGLGSNKAARGAFRFSDKFTEAGMYLAGKADEMTWVNIWDAVTHEVMDKYPNLSGDELDAKITERFNEVIGLTQVVDSILDSAPVLQEKVFSLAFPFMNEPVKSASNLILAASKFNQPGGKKKFAKAMGLQLLSAVLLEPLVTTLASMWRDEKDDIGNGFWDHFFEKMFGIKKDEDGFSSTDLESITTSNAFAGIWSMPFITQLYDTYSNAVQDYDNTSIDKAAAVDLVKAFQNLHKYNGASNEKSAKTQNRLWREFAESFASVLGVPAKTIRRQISGTARMIMNATDADELKWEYNKLSYNLENSNARSQKGFYDILAHAYVTGNMETYEKFRKELNDIVTDNSTLVDVNTIIKNIEKRGGNVQPGDPFWNVEVQARFRLDTPVKGWINENFLTGVYKQAEAAGIKDDECKKVLYSLPDKYEFEDEDGNDVEMSPAEYDQFASDCGDLAYKLVSQLSSSSNAKAWSALTIDQQLYAIEKVYDYSKRKFRKDINPDLNISGMGKDLVAVYETAPMDTSKIIAAVMDMAAGYKGEKDRKKK